MNRILSLILAYSLIISPVLAADNTVVLTPGAGVTMRTKDIGAGVQSPYNILGDTSGAAIYGTAGAANANVITVQGIASGTAQPVTLTSTTITGTVAVTQSTSPWVTTISGSSFTSTNLNVQCANCSGSGVSTADQATFTAGSSLFAGSGGFFQTTATNNPLTTGQQGMLQLTSTRAAFVNLRNASGTEIGTSTTPVIISQSSAAGLSATVVGNVAAGATDSGNPVKVGGISLTTAPTLSDGQRGDLQLDTKGNVKVTQTFSGGLGVLGLADNADGVVVSALVNKQAIVNRNTVFNGTTWDRAPGTISGAYLTLRDAAGNARGANVDASNRLTTAPTLVSGSVASGAYASGSIGSGAIASGAVASGAYASGALASGSIASGAMVDLLTVIGTKAAGTAATNSLLGGAVFNTVAPTLTNGQQAALQATSAGALIVSQSGTVTITSGSITIANTNPNGQAVAASSSPVVLASDKNISTTPYPIGSTVYTASTTGTISATTATLAGASSVTTYLCGFSIRANATAAKTGNATVTGTITGTLNFTQWTAPNASGLGVTEEIFSPCVPASGTNTSIAVVSDAPGTGGVVSVAAWGYKW